MLRVTWEWIGFEEALDVANTVAIADGVEHDLLAPEGAFDEWAAAAARSPALTRDEAAVVAEERESLLRLRDPIRAVIAATAAKEEPPAEAVAELNRASRSAPTWLEYEGGILCERFAGAAADRLLARYARSALRLAADGATRLRRCPAPSCGMFYRPRRRQQRWCSQACGNRARFARHYEAHRRRS